MSVLEPQDEPADTDHEQNEEDEVAEGKTSAIRVAELFEHLFTPHSSLRHLLEDNLHGIVHRRYPGQELDNWVGATACVGQTTSSEVEERDGKVTN